MWQSDSDCLGEGFSYHLWLKDNLEYSYGLDNKVYFRGRYEIFENCIILDIATAKKILTGYNELLNSEIPELSMGGLSVVCSASNTYLELAKHYNIDPPNSINKTESSAGTLLDKMSNKMSNKEQERFKIILEYLVNHEFATKAEISDLLDVEEKTAQRLLAKAVELELLITEGEYKSTIYKINPKL